MKLNTLTSLLFAFCLGTSFAQGGDSEADQLDQMRNFFCVTATQRYLMKKSSELPPLADPRELPASWRKLLALQYANCLQDVMDQSLLMKLAQARTPDDLDQIYFPFYDKIDIKSYLKESNFDLTKEDQEMLELSHRTAKKIVEMQEEHKKQQERAKANGMQMDDQQGNQYNNQEQVSTNWIDWVLNSQFRNVILLSLVGLAVLIIGSLGNMLKAGDAKKDEQSKRKKDKEEKKKQQRKISSSSLSEEEKPKDNKQNAPKESQESGEESAQEGNKQKNAGKQEKPIKKRG